MNDWLLYITNMLANSWIVKYTTVFEYKLIGQHPLVPQNLNDYLDY